MSAIEALPTWLPAIDFAVLGHGPYPGSRTIDDSASARTRSERRGKPMSEVGLETDRFELRLVLHSLSWHEVSEDAATISQVHTPLHP